MRPDGMNRVVGLPVPPICVAEGESECGGLTDSRVLAEEAEEALVEGVHLGEDVEMADVGPMLLGRE